MVIGIDKFREHLAGYEDHYALIGGAACDLILADAGLTFRATKDFDVVLCVEVVSTDFATAFLGFLDAGGYKARQKSDDHKEFFRFIEPADKTYPYMIELFSRKPGGLVLPDEAAITKIPVDEEILSLSAILLDEHYYAALQNSRTVVDGISILSEELLIPFKAKAYLDLTLRKASGEKLDSKTTRKHRNDVFRLAQLLPGGAKIDIASRIRDDLKEFLSSVRDDETLDPTTFDVPLSRAEGIALLESVYRLATN